MGRHGTSGPAAGPRGGRVAALVVLACLSAGCAEEPAPPRAPLRIGVHGDPSSLDPHLQSEVIAQWVLGNVYDTLVAFDVNMGLEPWLAERWENPSERVVRFHLRAGVSFHDGRPLTAADVAFSLERARRHPRSRSASALVGIEEVRVVDARTLELHTAAHYPILLNKLAFLHVVPAGSPEEIDRPVGTGPYRLTSYEPGRRAVLEAYAEHWRGAPAAPRVEYWFVSDPGARLERLLAGELDLAGGGAPGGGAPREGAPGFRVLSRSGLVVTYLQVNPAAPPFSDPRVRRALDLALDREALVRETLRGHGLPVGQMVSPNVYGYAPELAPPPPDRDEARRLLAAAGHGGGLELILELREGQGSPEPIRRQLAEVGVRLALVERPWSEMYPRLQSGVVPFYLGGWVCTSGDASDFLDMKAHSHDPERGYGASNSNRYSDPLLDALVEQAGTMRMEARLEVLKRALRMLAGEHVFIPLYTPSDLYGAREDLRWTPRQDGRIYAFEMERTP
jgi:peptide/nickel transport system substrate-binding protein